MAKTCIYSTIAIKSAYSIADKLGMDIWSLIDFYGTLDLPIIDGNIEDYENELKELEK